MELSENDFLQLSVNTPLINVDLFVVNQYGEVLLAWRDDEYCGTGWHIPGGIIRHGETMQERLRKTAVKEIGFLPEFELMPCKITEIFLKQKYRNHFISHLYMGWCANDRVKTENNRAFHRTGELCWFGFNPGLVYSQSVYEDFLNIYFATLYKKHNE